jgi:hypothetical protein
MAEEKLRVKTETENWMTKQMKLIERLRSEEYLPLKIGLIKDWLSK